MGNAGPQSVKVATALDGPSSNGRSGPLPTAARDSGSAAAQTSINSSVSNVAAKGPGEPPGAGLGSIIPQPNGATTTKSSSNIYVSLNAEQIAKQSQRRKLPSSIPYTTKMTGLCYDVRMRYHATVDEGDLHPEDPRRIYYIYKALTDAGLVDEDATGVPVTRGPLLKFRAREATKAEVLLVHGEDHWKFIEKTASE